ncbi:MAG TPA: alcohol dehydrogenase catalytic domain-containing protein [Thermoanaerobaculia bacterium]|nr:alcohol dehydrogenase catalytic domain-containing protein [Thermoanaerobaculia bacterium]
MNALLYRGPWQLEESERPEPEPPVGREVVVRIRATGICGTDLGIVTGGYAAARPPVVLGHESAGEVVATGDAVESLRIGDRVAIDPTYFCGACRMCRTGRQNHCQRKSDTETGVSRDGTFAPLYKTEERFLYPLPDRLSFAAASLAEPLSCALTGVDQVRLRPDLRALILGAGPLGVLYAHALACRGLGGAVVEISAPRRGLAQAALPPHWHCRSSLEEAIESLSEDGEIDLAVDTTGLLAAEVLPRLARGGQLLTIGLRPTTCAVDMLRVADRSLSIVGSIDSLGTFAAAVDLLGRGLVPGDRIVTCQHPLEDYRIAFAELGCDLLARTVSAAAGAIKVVLLP